ncbi:MAG: nicotinate-nucleotide adenylyltransferase [Pseudomonadota bacterium]|nr:nicotinate-nucleotide adenylyltransferase [Pseudomonadota bacterium]
MPGPELKAPIGIFGGTFAPIHNGHLRLAIELREQLGLERVLVLPAGSPPHRAAPSVPTARRVEWTRLAVCSEPGLEIDTRETARGGPSYSYDSVAALRRELGTDRPLCLLLGDDAANQFHTWHRWREMLDLAHLIFVERPYEPPSPSPDLVALLRGRRVSDAKALAQAAHGCWMACSIPPLAISSTRIRRLLAAGRSIRGLVPDAVADSLSVADIDALSRDEDPAYD